MTYESSCTRRSTAAGKTQKSEQALRQIHLTQKQDNAMDIDQTGAAPIDEGLYSRQLYVMGREAQLRMGASNVLIVGLNGLGVEIAKNVILAGVKSVTLHDDAPATKLDLVSQFYLSEADIGKPRAAVSVKKLAELNPYVPVRCHSGEITEEFLLGFRAVVIVNAPLKEAKRINAVCHAKSIAFIATEARGVFGSVFCDFGDEFIVSDRDGVEPVSCLISSISNSAPPLITVSDDTRHGLETGDLVSFREVAGFPFLNDGKPREVSVIGPFTFTLDTIDDADKRLFEEGQPSSGGYVTQVKQPLVAKFKDLESALATPGEFLISDFAKIGRSELLHVAFQALDAYQEKHQGRYPKPGCMHDAGEVFSLAAELNNQSASKKHFSVENIDADDSKKVIQALAAGAIGVLSPMAAFLGGIVGQEALKACSGKFTPIQQFFYFDAIECLPETVYADTPDEFAPVGSRYDGQIVVFGRKVQEKIKNLNMFLVGAGAIGCEMLKNWAMMGVASNKDATIHITDMDTIEKSNLNRQFLFRSKDVQQAKSSVAARAIKDMNPDVNVQSYVSRVGAESEDQFNDDFFESLSGVCTALDNVEARLYMDQRCLFYRLPMFESGTLGTKGNTQIVVPHKTENYGASRDPPEKSIPICTLKNFPNAIEHTLQWARDWFEGEFFQAPSDVNRYLEGLAFMKELNEQQNTKVETLERLKSSLVDNRPLSFEDCISWARFKFEYLFSNQIKQLLYNFPLDQLTTSGTPFWSGPKRPPTPIAFDAKDPLHLDFIVSVANSRAKNYGLEGHTDRDTFTQVLAEIHVPEFSPRKGVKIAASDAELKEGGAAPGLEDADAQCESILNELPKPSDLAGYRMEPIEFDKDDDSHMEVIVSVSNLRARSYKIPEEDMHKSRFIAGKIIPAIATTTALVTGLVCFEFLKVFQDKPLDHYKNGFVNLALPLFTFAEPIEPKATKTMLKGEEYKWTAWDRLEVDRGDMTLKEFLAYFEKEYDAEVTMLSYGVTILYAMYSQKSRSKERMAMKISDLVRTVTKKPIDPKLKYLILEVCAMDADGEDVELPYLRYHYKQQ
ncbi:Ubiquitin-like modifier-activating enzyme 1 [Phytophthora fragariae]|uniref:E1 ubiquitin-activating enzyme n=1 Tax=Phytophthora fragariae TaxID=53985 RepID=A0A6A3TEC7_9STRA|nr:Ubiquitin-like modifier-activating enzyme 1 [Phytophthora fragariae]KAE8947649.1 Ubiquitin-like modifier-activating enzyme 1 [Phytophthora fragariae]KAE9027227.1 Ubiquitin-like modifier-activating enzyme 1 [Phytophthora fragariae]KAE9135179.1 Ubiquitin-like modifier-activating enzyme 1 [Phytophthora fragariae]KAE9135403.1 Ubiquitin-like modifier-activating enzyme 1 [Phytophthora fragariae]